MCDKIYKHNKMSSIAVFSATFMIIAAIFLLLSVKNVRAEDEKEYKNVYINPDTGYEAIIEDDAALMAENDYEALLGLMKQITLYGNVMLKTIETNNMSTEGYIRALYNERFKSNSGTILVIDMDNRNIWIHSNGAINRTINKAYAETITDNVYTYASDADYYICAMKVYEQEYTLLQGRKIAQPMKYISNALLAIVIAVVINYIIVRVYSSKKKASTKSLMNGLFEYRAFNNCNVVFTHQTKTYSPRESSSGGSSGGGGGGGSSGGGGGSGGGHSF